MKFGWRFFWSFLVNLSLAPVISEADITFYKLKMVQKRLFVDEDLSNVSSKHPRQFVHNNELFPVLEFIPFAPALNHPFLTSGDILDDLEMSTEDTESRSEATAYASFSPEYFNPDRQIGRYILCEEVHSSVLDHPPQRSVPIGKDYQADIPIWNPQGTADSLNYLEPSEPLILLSKNSESKLALGNDNEKKKMGTSIILMSDSEQSAREACNIGNGRIDCACLDSGSFRCVRQHIVEARENLRKVLGTQTFLELGFCDMGEEVAEKWTSEEEQTFHEAVLSNPASQGKNFWDILFAAFPYRARKELVSYYFNVHVLRKRAEQNRCDWMSIDSDNEECQGSDYLDEENGMVVGDEDEDSVASPCNEDDPGYRQDRKDDAQEYEEDDANRPGYNNERACDHTLQSLEKFPWEERECRDVQDDSCTSSDAVPASHVTQVNAEDSDQWSGSFIGLNSGGSPEHVLEACGAKVWDTGYITCPRNKIDFLPTYSVIEEFLGDGDQNHNARDRKVQR